MADQPRNRFTNVIDLTSQGQREKSHEQAKEAIENSGGELPGATLTSLPETLQAAMRATGWTALMPVQEQAIPYMLDRRDLIVQSRTGSGKTGAFLLPLFELLDASRRETQAIILTPTRELARQIHEEFERMQEGRPADEALDSVLVYGGVKYGPQTTALRGGVQVVIGTPGRVLDHLERKNMRLDRLRVLVLDEADEMLSMGFYPSMRQLKSYLPEDRLSYMFSATMPPKVRSLARQFLTDPAFLALSTGHESVDAIEHRFYVLNAMEKDRALIRLIEMENPESAIIFTNTKRDVEYLTTFLQNYGHYADAISGDLSQQAREKVIDKIREGNLRFLVATDVAARGIDISDLPYVFIYDVPQDQEVYIHRSGRTARAGKSGVAITFATYGEKANLLSIAKRYGFEIEEHQLPSAEDVEDRIDERLTVVLEDRMREKSNLERERLQRFVPLAESLVDEEPELIALLLDDIYHKQMHAPPPQIETPDVDEDDETYFREDDRKDDRSRDRKGGGRKGGRKGGRSGRRNRDDDRGDDRSEDRKSDRSDDDRGEDRGSDDNGDD